MGDFDELANDLVIVERQDGSKLGPYKATVTEEVVVIYDDAADVEVGDSITRRLPNGRTERRSVTSANFYQAIGAEIPAHWQVKTGDASVARGQSPSPHITINNPQAVQIGDYNSQTVVGVLEMVAKGIDDSDASAEEKEEAKGRLRRFLEHPLTQSALGGAANAVLSSLS